MSKNLYGWYVRIGSLSNLTIFFYQKVLIYILDIWCIFFPGTTQVTSHSHRLATSWLRCRTAFPARSDRESLTSKNCRGNRQRWWGIRISLSINENTQYRFIVNQKKNVSVNKIYNSCIITHTWCISFNLLNVFVLSLNIHETKAFLVQNVQIFQQTSSIQAPTQKLHFIMPAHMYHSGCLVSCVNQPDI